MKRNNRTYKRLLNGNIVSEISKMQDRINKDKYNIDALFIEACYSSDVICVLSDDDRISTIYTKLRDMKETIRRYKDKFGEL